MLIFYLPMIFTVDSLDLLRDTFTDDYIYNELYNKWCSRIQYIMQCQLYLSVIVLFFLIEGTHRNYYL